MGVQAHHSIENLILSIFSRRFFPLKMNIFRDISLFNVSTYNFLKIRKKSENGPNELKHSSIDAESNGEQFILFELFSFKVGRKCRLAHPARD